MRRLWPFACVAALWAGAAAFDGGRDWVRSTHLPATVVDYGTEVRDRNGLLLRAYTVADGRWRLKTVVEAVDHRFLDMLVAYEDKRFYDHNGVDVRAVMRAVGQAIWNRQVVSGASTLTMQVARLLEDGTTGQWAGKLRQIRVALALEQRFTKREILNLYLSLAPYGGNLEGLRAASLAYFGKDPNRLSPAQSALLVALPQAPEARRPDRFPDRAQSARDRVLQRMIVDQTLPEEDLEGLKFEPISPQRAAFPVVAPHTSDRARRRQPDRQNISLTLDRAVQIRIESLAAHVAQTLPERLSIAILAADFKTGAVIASVGSAGYENARRQGFVDMTYAVRSPGSTLKPLIYGLAFDQGLIHPETVIDDRPMAFGSYAPQNFDGQFRGELKVAEALRLSLNLPVVALTDDIGPAKLMAGLRASGADPVLPGDQPGLAVALGGVGMRLWGLVQLYAGIANGGVAMPLQITGASGEGRQILSRAAAWQVGHILAALDPPGGAAKFQVAYKTGTSYGHRDAWAVGYDGGHVVGVWIGRPDGTPVPGAFGGDLAAPVLFDAFARLKPALDPLPLPPPETLLVSTSQLPQPLQRYRGRNAVFETAQDAPKLAFPPDGAVLEYAGPLVGKLRDGVPPFTWLANGQPVVAGVYDRQSELGAFGPGFVTLTVIDAEGRSDRAAVELR